MLLNYSSINRIISSFKFLPFSVPAINIVFNELNLKKKMKMKPNINSFSENFSKLEIVNLSFNYNTEKPNILKDINLTVKSGDLVGIIGQSGEGKKYSD